MFPFFAFLMVAAPDAVDRPGPGEPAPAFEADATNGRRIALGEFRNKQAVVLAFYPKAFTAG